MNLARRVWQWYEPVHALIYFAPEAGDAYTAAGLKGFWMGYFGSRSAAMGPVPADVVTATFYNFAPGMVSRAIPDAWSLSTPQRVLDARSAAADTTLRRLLGDAIGGDEVKRAAEVGRAAAEACRPEGRALFAGHASLPWPDEPHMILWHACTLLREHRGDGHVAALMSRGIDGCEANVLHAAYAKLPEQQAQYRGWTEDEWSAATERLRSRGLLDDLTTKHEIEDETDRLAESPLRAIDPDQFVSALTPITRAIIDGGAVNFPNPMGLTPPD